MKILLDECIPRRFKESLVGHICLTVPEVGLAGRKNGELLSLAEQDGFEVFLTLDKGLQYQQNLASGASQSLLFEHAQTGPKISYLTPKHVWSK